MTDKLKQTIKDELVKLPKENQEAINAFDWAKISEEISKKNLLDEIETNDLQLETLLVLIGLEDPSLYAKNLENNVGTTKDEAEKIAEEVFQRIFTPINNILVEKIKQSERAKNPDPIQTLNFILSGGDYSAFAENRDVQEEENKAPNRNIPVSPRKITDIKNKFTI